MKLLPFKHSKPLTLGIELEYQIVNPYTQKLASRAPALLHKTDAGRYKKQITHEITQGMIEINSSVHHTPQALLKELKQMRAYLICQSQKLGLSICGGGTHPFEKWSLQKIYPTPRYKKLARQFRFLSKQATVFGQHIHIGCKNGDDAIYLTHALARYVPHLIALSAASPYYEGDDSGYASWRWSIFPAFPFSGQMPPLRDWREFSAYLKKMRDLKIIKTMKDVYWDIRPKPEFGTVEVRVCDTPLTINKAVLLAAYVQTLAAYLLQERPGLLTPDLFDFYSYNRFQAARYAFKGDFINPVTLGRSTIGKDILETITILEKYARELKNKKYLDLLKESVDDNNNDAADLREIYQQTGSLNDLVIEQCVIWGE